MPEPRKEIQKKIKGAPILLKKPKIQHEQTKVETEPIETPEE